MFTNSRHEGPPLSFARKEKINRITVRQIQAGKVAMIILTVQHIHVGS